MPHTAKPLTGCTVLVTRPEEQALALISGIESRGGRAVFAPMIVISGRTDDDTACTLFETLDSYQVVIFVSRNAAEFGVSMAARAGRSLDHAEVFAVGAGTASRLHELGVEHVHTPKHEFTSEGLLKLPGLSHHEIAGKRVLIVRGTGGREMLGQTLQQRGAMVDYAEVYTRTPPTEPLAGVLERHGVSHPDVGIVNSLEALTNLAFQIDAEGLDPLYDLPLLVAGARTAQEVERLGFTQEPMVLDNPGDASVLQALVDWVGDGD